jgi:rhamnogalacturonan endolyase
MKTIIFTALLSLMGATVSMAEEAHSNIDRALWGAIADKPGSNAINNGGYTSHNGKILLSWRMLPGDDKNTGFDLYRTIGNGNEVQINRQVVYVNGVAELRPKPILATNYTDSPSNMTSDIKYRLTLTGSNETVGTYTFKAQQLKSKLPYIEIPLKTTEDVSSYKDIVYQANDCSVGDLDGDGQLDIVVKRLLTILGSDGSVLSDGTGAGDSDKRARHCVLYEAYKLDGTFLWRVMSGPNIILGNSSNFAVADLDGDGCCEVVTKTGEGTIFGDGYEILDTDGDGKTDYRDVWPAGHYTGDGPKGYGGPEFFSVIDGKTGKELARANFITRGAEGETPAQLAKNWEANDWLWDPRTKKYQWKLANSLRLGVAEFTGKGMQIFLGRGVYGRTVVEGWQYAPEPTGQFAGTLTRLWKIDTNASGGKDKNKDGKAFSAYAGQGNHAFNVADLDGDGLDEVMYGSCAWDNDGTGLWSSGLGHGDANHVGSFLPDREGLQVFHCLENGRTMVALHDAKDGSIIWKKDGAEDNDMGRCLCGDFDANSPGFEFYYYQGNIIRADGTETATNTKGIKGGCSMAIWFDGSLIRQQMEDNIVNSMASGRTFTMWPFGMASINDSKANPCWYGDMVGDWREEIIMPDETKLRCLKLFSTWYPTGHRFPWLMTDHTYKMQTIHQQVGYNQPNNLGYYLGADVKKDEDAWAAAQQVESNRVAARAATLSVTSPVEISPAPAAIYNLMGQKVQKPSRGLYIEGGRKVFYKRY